MGESREPVSAPAVTKQDRGRKPELAWLAINKLSVDAKYQRDTGSRRSRNLIDKIANDFRWSRFGVVLAVKHKDGYFIIDGQHRVEAARQAGDIDHIPAVVLPHATVEAAAADFVAINRDRVTVTPLHIHHAMLAAGDPDAVAVDKVCGATGVRICRYPIPSTKIERGQTLAVATIARLVKRKGDEFATRVLQRVLKASKADDAVNAAAIRYMADELGGGQATEKPAALIQRSKRNCLKCGQPFASEGSHNRMCHPCRTA